MRAIECPTNGGHTMRQFIIRLFFYILIIAFFTGIFTRPDSGPLPNSTTAGVIGYYVAYYGLTFSIWILIFEGIFRLARYIHRTPKMKRIFFLLLGSYMVVQTVVWVTVYVRYPERRGVLILLLSGLFVLGGFALLKKARNMPELKPVPETK